LGISSCLLGEEVRFDGGHKKNRFLVDVLGQYVEWFAVCPEVEMGMGTPRESIRLQGKADHPILIGPRSGTDYTEGMLNWSRQRLDEIESWNLHGYVLKKDSPSCGLFRVRVYDENGQAERNGRGVFARELTARMPLLPVEEEGRLNDLRLRENFIERIFIYERWLRLLDETTTPAALVAFHTAHKLTVMSHSPRHYRQLGRLVADAGKASFEGLLDDYSTSLGEALAILATRGRHTNVLQHLLGFLKRQPLERDEIAELVETIESYRLGLVPLIVPLTLLNHHFRKHDVPDWVHDQVYLKPYPKELMLRNHV
jgi:uncharacterized protein YbgA (DUF1722 family)/uncharacterized protein YbbK (DUF523 family)